MELRHKLSQDSTYQKSAQDYLHNLQKEPFAWELAPHLLSSQSENSQFFGAHTYQVKIARDWSTIPEDRIEWMREELIRWIVRYSNGPAFIRTKLCLALSTYAIHAVPTYWSNFISSFYQNLRARVNQSVDGAHMSQQSMELALLEFLTIVAEELGRAEVEPTRSIIQPILGLALNALLDDDTFDAAAEVWSEIMSSTAAAKYQDTVCEGLMPCFASDWARNKQLESIQAESEDISRRLCQLLSTFGDNFSDWIAARFLRPDIVVYLEMMMGFTGFPGYYAEDETISDLSLNFWYMLQESLSELQPEDSEDEEGGVMGGDNADDDRQVTLSTISSASSITGLNKQSLQAIKEASVHVYIRLTEVFRKKLQYPPQKEWMTWARDIRQEFTGHRQEIADTLINSYHVLHDQILALLIDTCVVQIDDIQKASSILETNTAENSQLEIGLVQLEATLYCLKALSEVVPHTEDTQMPRFFSDQIFGRLPTTILCRARETALGLIGAYADWFKVHPQFLLPVLNFVIPALEVPQLAPYAARALKNICDTCRESLVEAIDAFMTVFANVERAIDPAIKGSVVFSIATVIQTLPVERSIGPLVGLLGDIFTRSNECLETRKQRLATGNSEISATQLQTSNGEMELEPLSALMLQQLEFLLSCCRGLQSPLEEEIRTADERIQIYQATVEERRRVLTMGGMAIEVTRSMEQIIQGTVIAWPHELEIVERVCQIIKTMMTSSQFSPLYLPLPLLLSVIETGFQQHAFPCWLDAAAKVVSVYYFEATGGSLIFKLGTGSMATALNGSNVSWSHGDLSSSSQIVDVDTLTASVSRPARGRTAIELENEAKFTHLLSTLFVRHAPIAFYSIPLEQTENLMRFAVAGLALQERLALKATLLFLIEFVNQNYDYPELKHRVDELMVRIGPQMIRGILLGIGGHVPRSMVPQLNDALYPLIGKFAQECRGWMQSLLAEPGFPSNHADQASKEKFIKGVMQTRSPKRFKDEVHQFSNKCRQLDGSAFGSAV
ncbi:hypothetical protein EDD11_006508 [Mortierella claussenii]|nr:hypothetical protein EDD11_006508 [Mortierella claussenii]